MAKGYYSIASGRWVSANEVHEAETAVCEHCGHTYAKHGFCDVCPDGAETYWKQRLATDISHRQGKRG